MVEDAVKNKHLGYVHNCYLHMRKEDNYMFWSERIDGQVRTMPALDGYAIIPMEMFEEMKKAASDT